VADSPKRSANATADELYANIKYETGRTVRNWAHVAAASNSRRAIKVTWGDRRWFLPKVTETLWPTEPGLRGTLMT